MGEGKKEGEMEESCQVTCSEQIARQQASGQYCSLKLSQKQQCPAPLDLTVLSCLLLSCPVSPGSACVDNRAAMEGSPVHRAD